MPPLYTPTPPLSPPSPMRVQLSPRIMDRNTAVINNSLPPRARALSGSSVSSNNSNHWTHANTDSPKHPQNERRGRHLRYQRRKNNSPRRRSESDDDSDDTNKNKNTSNLQELERALEMSIAKLGTKEHAMHAPIYNHIGNLQFRQGNMTAAKHAYQQAIVCDESMAQAFLNLSTVYWTTGQVKEAIPLLQQAELEVVRKDQTSSETMASVCHQLGLCHGLLHEFDTAIAYMQQALQIRQDNKAEADVAKTHDALGKIYFLKKDFDAAIQCHERAWKLLQQAGCDTHTVLQNLVNAFVAKNDEDAAIQVMCEMALLLRQDLKKSFSKQTVQTLRETLGAIADLYDEMGQQDEAARYRREVVLLENR